MRAWVDKNGFSIQAARDDGSVDLDLCIDDIVTFFVPRPEHDCGDACVDGGQGSVALFADDIRAIFCAASEEKLASFDQLALVLRLLPFFVGRHASRFSVLIGRSGEGAPGSYQETACQTTEDQATIRK
jgi:hypothetical protein